MPTLSPTDRTALVAIMAHEIRTPLSIMVLLAEQLKANDGDTMTEQQVESASVLHACGRDLQELLDSVLDLAASDAGTLTVDLVGVAVSDVRDTLCREFAYLARDRRLDLLVEIAPDVPAEFVTDPLRLRQVLTNLLANAIKFTEYGGVRVCFDLVDARPGESGAASEDGRTLAISVIDTGIGIDALDQERIFEAFTQANAVSGRRTGGAGLGLSISRQLVGLLGGRITVSSQPGEGSTFTVHLPLRLPVTTPDPPRADAAPQLRANAGRLLWSAPEQCVPS